MSLVTSEEVILGRLDLILRDLRDLRLGVEDLRYRVACLHAEPVRLPSAVADARSVLDKAGTTGVGVAGIAG